MPQKLDRSCTFCGSKQTTERREQDGIMVTISIHCNACRKDLMLHHGNIGQTRAWVRNRRRIQRRAGKLYCVNCESQRDMLAGRAT